MENMEEVQDDDDDDGKDEDDENDEGKNVGCKSSLKISAGGHNGGKGLGKGQEGGGEYVLYHTS